MGAALLLACLALTLWTIAGGSGVPVGNRSTVTVQPDPSLVGPGGHGRAAGLSNSSSLGSRLAGSLALQPRVIENRIAGYSITAKSDPAMLSAARLKVGDMLIELDGHPLDHRRLSSLEEELAQADSVEILLQRGNQMRTLVIDLRG